MNKPAHGSFRRQIREMWEVPRDILRGRYPPFVTGGPLPRGDVPVFVFHSLEPGPFARKLGHLADNGYQTLSSAEYLDVLTGARPAPERAVGERRLDPDRRHAIPVAAGSSGLRRARA